VGDVNINEGPEDKREKEDEEWPNAGTLPLWKDISLSKG